MISEIERNYETRSWTAVGEIPRDVDGLIPMQLYHFCNSDSRRFDDLLRLGRGEKAVLLDYEFYSIGLEPNCGSVIEMNDTHVFLTVFTKEGNKHFQAPRSEFPQLPVNLR
jgi:hypothetical protein